MAIDIAYMLLILLAVYNGYRKGVVSSVMTFVAVLISLLAALKLSEVASVYLLESFNIGSKYLPVISFVLVFLLSLLVLRLLTRMIEKLMHILQLSFLNRMGGVLFWSVMVTLVFSTAIWYLDQMAFFTSQLKNESVTFDFLYSLAPLLIQGIGSLLPFIQDTFESLESFFEELADRAK